MAANTRTRQAKQTRNSEVYDDTRPSGSSMESSPENLEEDLNNIRSQLRRVIGPAGDWYDLPLTSLADIGVVVAGSVRYFQQPLIGAINGTNTVFTSILKWMRNGITNESVFYNGVRLLQGVGNDYVASESSPGDGYDTVTLAFAPRVGDSLQIDFNPTSS